MKKKILFLVLVAIVTIQAVYGQHRGNPIRPYNENGYTISDFKYFVFDSGSLSANYRAEMLRIINNGIYAAGENFRFNEIDLNSLIDHNISFEEVRLDNFTNSMRIGERIVFYKDKNFRGTVGVFQYGKCRLVLFKTICLNLLEVPVEIIEVTRERPVKVAIQEPAPKPKVEQQQQTYKFVIVQRERERSFRSDWETQKTVQKDIKFNFFGVTICVVGVGAFITAVILTSQNKVSYSDDRKSTSNPITPNDGPGGAPPTTDGGPGGVK